MRNIDTKSIRFTTACCNNIRVGVASNAQSKASTLLDGLCSRMSLRQFPSETQLDQWRLLWAQWRRRVHFAHSDHNNTFKHINLKDSSDTTGARRYSLFSANITKKKSAISELLSLRVPHSQCLPACFGPRFRLGVARLNPVLSCGQGEGKSTIRYYSRPTWPLWICRVLDIDADIHNATSAPHQFGEFCRPMNYLSGTDCIFIKDPQRAGSPLGSSERTPIPNLCRDDLWPLTAQSRRLSTPDLASLTKAAAVFNIIINSTSPQQSRGTATFPFFERGGRLRPILLVEARRRTTPWFQDAVWTTAFQIQARARGDPQQGSREAYQPFLWL